MDQLTHLQELLRELFRLEFADLDFGLYRLLHLKRSEIEAFLTEQLPRRVREAFQGFGGEERVTLERELQELAGWIRKDVAEDAISDDGDVATEYRDLKVKAARDLIGSYQAKRQQLQSVQVSEAHQAEVFNHLYTFFSRYYEAGDFIPRRRYGAHEAYAVPYNGEEVLFHWANKDQHYVKTAEAFRDYTFLVEALGGPYKVRFALTVANVPPGNVKGDTRYFFPLSDEATWDPESRTFRLPFHYRLPTEKEVDRFRKNSKLQEAVLLEALAKVLTAVPNPTLRAALSAVVEQKDDQEISLLLKRLRHFTRRNTTDYFIHRNLDAFLKRELEFYLKDQVLHLGDLDGDLESKRRTLRVIRQLAEEVIAFLAQIEEVERRLFEKRKFVLRTDYLAPIKEVPRDLWAEVLANTVQVAAWKSLFAIEPKKDLFNQKGKVNERFLEEHPTLVVDTRHFDANFKDRLLAAFDDLDDATDGLLVHSENYQALRLLQPKYAGKIKCIYIDPPYNTGSDDFVYKDRYQHSSWLAMMTERLLLARALMHEDGALFVQIGDEEADSLKKSLCLCFGEENFRNTIVVRRGIKNVQSQFETISALSVGHDLIYAFTRSRGARLSKLYEETDEGQPGKWDTYWRGTDRPTMRYAIFGQKPDHGQWRWSEERAKKAKRNYEEYLERHASHRSLDEYFLGHVDATGEELDFLRKNEEGVVQYYVPPRNYKLMSDLWLDVPTRGSFAGFATEKNTALMSRIIKWVASAGDLTLDCFAGSGSTGHSAIILGRQTDARRKFILVEMANHFDTVLVPRIQRSLYAPEWSDEKPSKLPGEIEVDRTPRLVKVLRLEGYEDALHNLVTEETARREGPRAAAYKTKLGEDAYRLGYLVRLPLESSASMLNLSALEHPFRYTIEALTEDGPRVETVDLVETFNYLYGLHVERLEVWTNEKDLSAPQSAAARQAGARRYKVVQARDRAERRVLVVWRDMKDLDPVIERTFLEAKAKSEGPFDEMLINGDTATPGFASLDGLFKRLMEEGES